MELLSRDEFRGEVFKRDDYKCVVCKEPAKDAHHILERRLWDNGGYYPDNGASLCEKHHIQAEQTVLSCEDIRKAAKIESIILPEHLYEDNEYDKWGNILLSNGRRAKGELFFDESVQKILKEGNVLDSFTNYLKYPRTYHLPWSEGRTKDDRALSNTNHFEGKRVIVTVKMDGENTTMYSNYLHARSIDSLSHPSQSWVRNFHSQIKYNIPEEWRVCGENLFAEHNIHYKELPSYFMLFSIWNGLNECLSWDETKEWAELLDVSVVPVIYDDIWNEDKIKKLYSNEYSGNMMEGYVVRIADEFQYSQFRRSVAKYVRKDHIQEGVHQWRHKRIIKNELA